MMKKACGDCWTCISTVKAAFLYVILSQTLFILPSTVIDRSQGRSDYVYRCDFFRRLLIFYVFQLVCTSEVKWFIHLINIRYYYGSICSENFVNVSKNCSMMSSPSITINSLLFKFSRHSKVVDKSLLYALLWIC